MINKLMCHVVAGYPDQKSCIKLMQSMDQSGVAAIEVQIPFSDPIADGATIMYANDIAVSNGITVKESFELISQARRLDFRCELIVMSYFQKVQSFGIEKFCEVAKLNKVGGFIIPDLPFDTPEYDELKKISTQKGIQIIPVVSPGMVQDRLEIIMKSKPKMIYVTSQKGITGNQFTESRQLKEVVENIRQVTPASEIMIGFGISTPHDVREALSIGDLAVVGSAIVRKIDSSGISGAISLVKTLAKH